MSTVTNEEREQNCRRRAKTKGEMETAMKLELFSAAWQDLGPDGEPTERQFRERGRVMRDRREVEGKADAKRSQRAQRMLEVYWSDDARTAMLAMIGAATAYRRIGMVEECKVLLLTALEISVRWRFLIQTGKVSSLNQTLEKCAQTLRTIGVLERRDFLQVRGFLATRSMTKETHIDWMFRMVRRITDFTPPWEAPTEDRSEECLPKGEIRLFS